MTTKHPNLLVNKVLPLILLHFIMRGGFHADTTCANGVAGLKLFDICTLARGPTSLVQYDLSPLPPIQTHHPLPPCNLWLPIRSSTISFSFLLELFCDPLHSVAIGLENLIRPRQGRCTRHTIGPAQVVEEEAGWIRRGKLKTTTVGGGAKTSFLH